MLHRWIVGHGLVLLLVVVPIPANAGEVRISAASSLAEAVSEVCRRYETKYSGVTLIRNFAASGTLAKQIANGAPVDLFVSANPVWKDYLVELGRVPRAGSRNLASNDLVVVGRKGENVDSLADLTRFSRIAIGSPKSVPAGEYAETALKSSGVYTKLREENRLVMAKDVRQALMYAERGEADAALVYRTDALLAREAVILYEVPRELYPPITYPAGLTVDGMTNSEAVDFFVYLNSSDVAMVLGQYGFVTAAGSASH